MVRVPAGRGISSGEVTDGHSRASDHRAVVLVVGVVARLAVGFGWATSLLLGAAVSSTDAAAVFSAVRDANLRRRLASILEAESGFNDPFAAVLVIGLVEWRTHTHFGAGDAVI